MKQYAYIRVSTKEQNPERQINALRSFKIPKEHIYIDCMSGKDFLRPNYRKLLKQLNAGDFLIIKSIDRLGRNYNEILEQWRIITKEIKAHIQVLDMPLLNTDASHGDLTGDFVADLVLQILAYVAETERSMIRRRQAEGIAAAKQRGIKFGHQKIEMPENFAQYYKLWEQGELSTRQAAKILNVSHTTFYRRCCELRKGKN